ncbi:MFS transporter [Pantoea agglomerans]|uniref:MFS transporter n=1 Tax=Enterobacter agglomerans TaxID=549 RepID=UPI003209C607
MSHLVPVKGREINSCNASDGCEDPQHFKVNKTLIFTVLATVQATLIFTIVMIGVPLPSIAQEFSLVQAQLVLVSAAYGLPFSGLLLFGGRLSDRYSGRVLFTVGMLIFGLASVSGFIAPDYWTLITIRLLQGIGAACIAPALMSLLRQLYPVPVDFQRAMATWGGVSVLGGAVGFLSSGIVTSWLSWRWMFLIPVLVAFLGMFLIRRMMPPVEKGATISKELDRKGAILATLGISTGSYGLIMSGEYPWLSSHVLVPFITGLLLIIIFFKVEVKVKSPLLPPDFIRQPTRLIGLAGILLAAAGMGLITLLLSLYLQQLRGWSSFTTSMAFIPYTFGLLMMNRAAGPLVMRFGAMKVMISGLLIGSLGLTLLSQITLNTDYSLGLLPGLFILPAGASLVFSACAVLSTTNVPLHQAGLAGGVMNTAMELGPTLGLAILMSIAASRLELINGYAWAFGSAAIFYLIAAVLACIFGKRIN